MSSRAGRCVLARSPRFLLLRNGGTLIETRFGFDDRVFAVAEGAQAGGAIYVAGTTLAVANTRWGAPQLDDVPVAGDYDGDGQTDIAVYRSISPAWVIRRSSDGGTRAVLWGTADSVPIPGDYNGDDEAEFVVFARRRPSGRSGIPGRASPVLTAEQTPSVRGSVDPLLDDTPVPGALRDHRLGNVVSIYRRGTGHWFIRDPFSGPVAWGNADLTLGDTPVNLPRALWWRRLKEQKLLIQGTEGSGDFGGK